MRYYLTFCLLILYTVVFAQNRRNQTSKNPFLKTQWYLGFFAGGNLAKATPTASFYGYEPLNYSNENTTKTYNGFKELTTQAGLVFMFYTQGFTISVKPSIQTYQTGHTTGNVWKDSNNSKNTLQINYNHSTKFNYLEFPLSVQYDLLSGKLRPFVGFGGYYGVFLSANRTIERSGSDAASGAAGNFNNDPKTIGITNLFITSAVGIQGFVGASYDPGNIRITLDIGYKMGLNNITNTKNRYLINDLSALGEAMDDVRLQDLYFNLGFVFPLKFISKNFDAIN